MLLSAALEEYLYSRDLTPSARRWYTQKLGTFIEWCEHHEVRTIEEVTSLLVHKFLADLREKQSEQYKRPLSSYTVRGYIRVVKCWLSWCARDDLLPEKVVKRVDMPKVEYKVVKTIPTEQVAALLRACEDQHNPHLVARDKALVAVLLDSGCRAAEICGLTLERVTFTQDTCWLLINGKGRKQRQVSLGLKSRQLLHKYVYRHREASSDETHVFVTHTGKPLQPEGLDRMLYRVADRAGVKGVRAHVFRHTHGCRYIEQGGDIYALSQRLGHSDITVTQLYLKDVRQRMLQGPSVLDNLK